ncbi:hypothetical protein L6452_08926 [Arctium lappa]|uniref:Uncharacterized protein n=1 Tax=Arctium lappa TaxID=4217 RepID=A0ACB9DIY4_ARCLA|nr:hypothetical protein L6452_08926 [Arctium lappa]
MEFMDIDQQFFRFYIREFIFLQEYFASERAVPRPDDSEIATLRLSEEASTSRSTMNNNRRGAGALDPVVALDESSPEVGNRRSNTHRSSTEDPSFRALQVEADEMLAKELQEQLYNEKLAPVWITNADYRG